MSTFGKIAENRPHRDVKEADDTVGIKTLIAKFSSSSLSFCYLIHKRKEGLPPTRFFSASIRCGIPRFVLISSREYSLVYLSFTLLLLIKCDQRRKPDLSPVPVVISQTESLNLCNLAVTKPQLRSLPNLSSQLCFAVVNIRTTMTLSALTN